MESNHGCCVFVCHYLDCKRISQVRTSVFVLNSEKKIIVTNHFFFIMGKRKETAENSGTESGDERTLGQIRGVQFLYDRIGCGGGGGRG